MQIFLAYLFLGLGLITPAVLNRFMLSRWFPFWWNQRWVRGALFLCAVACVALYVIFLAGAFLHFAPSRTMLGLAMILAWLPQLALLISLPLVILWQFASRRFLQLLEKQPPSEVDLRRRRFLQASGSILPLTAVGASVTGVTSAMGGANSFIEKLSLPGLPPALVGLRILQLSDVHLGGFMPTQYLAQTLENARPHKPDLIVLTGDFADDFRLVPKALEMLEEFPAPLGVFAILGNHEYGNGVEEYRSLVANSRVQLLVNTGHRIIVGDAALYLAGVDDISGRPRATGRKRYMESCVRLALRDRRSNDFPILLTHRPDTFKVVADHNIPLTLAGHTHGGQAAVAGKSWLQLVGAEDYSWGFYRHGDSLLYTTSGAGQWFPVRLGCPTEAVVFELGKGGKIEGLSV